MTRHSGEGIWVDLDDLLAERGMTLVELADRVGVMNDVNLGRLKNGRASGIRWQSLAAICRVLECQPGDLLRYEVLDGTRDMSTVLLRDEEDPVQA